jgi:hypothetical protein
MYASVSVESTSAVVPWPVVRSIFYVVVLFSGTVLREDFEKIKIEPVDVWVVCGTEFQMLALWAISM